MSIDINKIAQEKITEMEKNGEIKKEGSHAPFGN